MKLSYKFVQYLLPYIFFGSFNYYFAKEAVSFSSPITFNLIRYLVSTLIFLFLGGKLLITKDVSILALSTSLSSLLWAYGLLYVSPAESAVLSYTMPLFSIPISYLVLSDKPTRLEVLGTVIGFIGVILYGLPLSTSFTLLGAIVTIINAIFWATFSVYYRKLRNQDPVNVNFSQFLLGSVFFSLLIPIDPKIEFNREFIYGIAYTSTLGGALSFFLWNLMIKIEKVARVTVFSFLVPIVTTIEGVILFNQYPLPIQIAGILLMFTGIIISRIAR